MTDSFAKRRCLWLVGLMLLALPCFARQINLFATAEGPLIKGYAYLRNGERLRDQAILIRNAEGLTLGGTTTDAHGAFTFHAKIRCDHIIILEMTDGRRISFTVTAAELPDSLPLPAETAAVAPRPSAKPPAALPSDLADMAELTRADVAEVVAQTVSDQLRPLRAQLDAYAANRRFHDIIGGIGYLLGFVGIACYLFSRRAPRRVAPAPESAPPEPSAAPQRDDAA